MIQLKLDQVQVKIGWFIFLRVSSGLYLYMDTIILWVQNASLNLEWLSIEFKKESKYKFFCLGPSSNIQGWMTYLCLARPSSLVCFVSSFEGF